MTRLRGPRQLMLEVVQHSPTRGHSGCRDDDARMRPGRGAARGLRPACRDRRSDGRLCDRVRGGGHYELGRGPGTPSTRTSSCFSSSGWQEGPGDRNDAARTGGGPRRPAPGGQDPVDQPAHPRSHRRPSAPNRWTRERWNSHHGLPTRASLGRDCGSTSCSPPRCVRRSPWLAAWAQDAERAWLTMLFVRLTATQLGVALGLRNASSASPTRCYRRQSSGP